MTGLLDTPAPAGRVLNPADVLPANERQHFVVVADDFAGVDIEHIGCPLIEEDTSGGPVVDYDCLGRWVTHDNAVAFIPANDPDGEWDHGEFATYRVLPGRWKLDVSLWVSDDPNTGYDEDWTVVVDPEGLAQ